MDEKQFGILPSKKIFIQFAIPSIFSMIFSSIGIIVDGIFVGKFIGSEALAAVNILMPILMITFALADMIAVGSSVKISIALGRGNNQLANRAFSTSLMMIVLLGILITILGFAFGKPIIYNFIQDSVLADLAFSYVKPFFYMIPFAMPLFAVDNYLRICGKANFSMWVNISISLLNIVLDWLLIGQLRMGIEAASLATGISMSIGCAVAIFPFILKRFTLRFTKPVLHIKDIVGIIYNGSSEFFNNIASSLMAIVINSFLLRLGGALAVAAYSIVMYIDAVLMMGLYGMLDSIQPAVSYNIGANNTKKVMELFKISCVVACITSIICMIGTLLFPEFLASLFVKSSDTNIIELTKTALYLFAPAYLFLWFNMVSSSFLTSFDKPKESLIIMVFRAVVFPLIAIFVMTNFIGIKGVFITPTIAGGFTMIISIFIWKKTIKKMKKKSQ